MVSTVRRQETHEQAVRRLAAKARESGVRLVRGRTGRYYASSASTPGTWHFVTAFSCDCQGFVSHQKCMHNSALLVAMGFVPTELEPACVACSDTGMTVKHRSRWIGGCQSGYRSTWMVTEPCESCSPNTAA